MHFKSLALAQASETNNLKYNFITYKTLGSLFPK